MGDSLEQSTLDGPSNPQDVLPASRDRGDETDPSARAAIHQQTAMPQHLHRQQR